MAPTSFGPVGVINDRPMFYSAAQKETESVEAEWRYGMRTEFSSCGISTMQTDGNRRYYSVGNDGETPVGAITCRVRVVGTEDWTEMSWPDRGALSGEIISGGAWKASGALPPTAFDGNVSTFCEPSLASDTNSWFGLDLGARKLVTGCRIMPRNGWTARTEGRRIEVADKADFSDAKLAGHTPSTTNYTISTTMFDIPVRGRYVRIKADSDVSVYNYAEVEFVTSEREPSVVASVSPADVSEAHAVVSWNASMAKFPYVNVYSAPAFGGPWTLRQTVPFDANWTNDTDVVGVKMYYAVAESSGTAETSMRGTPISYVRPMRIDRDPADETKLRKGMTAFAMRNVTYSGSSYSSKAFDGNTNSCPDAKANKTGAVAIGLDMAADYVITGVGLHPNSYRTFYKRLADNWLWGTPDGQDRLAASTKLNSEKVPLSTSWIAMASGFVTTPVRSFYLYGNSEFYGNVGEIQIYGYPASALMTNLTVPEAITVLPRANGVFVTWQPCPVATSYSVERRTVDGAWSEVYAGTVASCLDTSAETGVRYGYRVKVIKDSAYGYSGTTEIDYDGAAEPVSAEWREAVPIGELVTGGASVAQDGTISLRAANGETDRYGEKGYGLFRAVTAGAIITGTMTADTNVCINGETVYLTVRAGQGEGQPFAAVGFRVMKSYDGLLSGAFGVRSRTTVNGAVTENVVWTEPVSDLASAQLRIKQKGNRVRCWKRTAADSDWVLLATVTFPTEAFGQAVETGVMATTPCGGDAVPESQWTITDYEVVPSPGLIFTIR